MTRIYRFFLRENHSIDYQNPYPELILDKNYESEIFFQLQKVLRVKSTDQIVFLNRNRKDDKNLEKFHEFSYPEFFYQIKCTEKKKIILNFQEIKWNSNELKVNLQLALCLPNKPAKLDFIIEKAVELGVKGIIPLKSDYSQFSHSLKKERLDKIILEASEQSERGVIATLQPLISFQEFINKYDPKRIFMALERLNIEEPFDDLLGKIKKTLKDSVPNDNTSEGSENLFLDLTLLIGPEGGFSDHEKEMIHQKKVQIFSLGKRVLRMETAAILALGIFSSKVENFIQTMNNKKGEN